MSKDQMDRIKKNIETLMIAEVAAKVNNKLTDFESDDQFCADMQSQTNTELGGFSSLIPILDTIVMQDYTVPKVANQEFAPEMKPVVLSPFYRVAMKNGALGRYGILVDHVKKMISLEPKVVYTGVKANTWTRNPFDSSSDFVTPTTYEEGSYPFLLLQLFYNKTEKDVLSGWFDMFDKQLSAVKESFALGGLINLGYVGILGKVYTKSKTLDDAEKMFSSINSIFAKVEGKGLNIYDTAAINMIKNNVGVSELHNLDRSLDMYCRQTFMKKFSLNLTTEQ